MGAPLSAAIRVSRSQCSCPARLAKMTTRFAAFGLLVVVLGLAALERTAAVDDIRRVVLAEKHGFLRGHSVDISLVEAPGVTKLLAVVCKDPTLSLCQGFALDGKTIYPMKREPMHYDADSVFEAFFGGPYLSSLFGPDASARRLKPFFTLSHQENGSFTFQYDFKDIGLQKISLRPNYRHMDFQYLFIGVEVKIGVSDPVGVITTF